MVFNLVVNLLSNGGYSMNRHQARIWQFFGLLILLTAVLTSLTWADDDDPPARVARMNFTQGSVSFQPGEGDWLQAVPNRPLTTGDNLWTDRGSRAELHVGSTSIRLGSETSLTFLELDDRSLQLRLAQGSAFLRVRHLDDEDNIEIDTPNLAFRVQRNGEYRVDVDPDGRTTLVDVFQGSGEAIGGGNNYTIVADQQAVFTGNDDLNYDIDPLPSRDGFDDWAFERDRREDEARSANYVSREMTGYEDLDGYGRWSYAGNYGNVWVPTGVPVGWAPYRFGHWIWVAPWGWTWVDDQPWGFAPFHYGRWCLIGGGWAWVPGPVAMRPVYAPALVAFVGGGPRLTLSFGGGSGVAWFPLGPGEVFVPAYRVSRTYVNQVNVTNTVVNVTHVTNVYNYYTTSNTTNVNRITYVNRTAPNGVTAVSRETFVNARPIARNIVSVPQREIEQAPVSHLAGAEPIRASFIGVGRPTSVAPPARVANRQVIAVHTPAPPTVPFSQRRDPLVARPGRPVTVPTITHPESIQAQPNQPRPVPGPNPPAIHPEWQAPRPGSETPHPEGARPEPPRNEERMRQAEPHHEPNAPPGWSHPLAKPAPAVQQKTPQQAQQEENKYQRWEQRAKPAPPRPPEHEKQRQ